MTRRDLAVIARLDLVALVAFASARTEAAMVSVALVLLLAAWPITVVVPMHWRGEVEQDTTIRHSSLFLVAFVGVFVVAYGHAQDASYPSTALLLAFATAHMVAVWFYLHAQLGDLRAFPAWIGGCMLFIAGTLADLPGSLGWNAVVFGLYGLVSGATIHRVQMRGRAEAAGSRPGPAPE